MDPSWGPLLSYRLGVQLAPGSGLVETASVFFILIFVGAWDLLGVGYGWCLSRTAHHGYLPFWEPA